MDHAIAELVASAQAVIDAMGGDVPDWLEAEIARMQSALGAYWAQREKVSE